jgi:hypothetical protein
MQAAVRGNAFIIYYILDRDSRIYIDIYIYIYTCIYTHRYIYVYVYTVVPPYRRVILSKTYRGYVKPQIIPNAIYNVIFV